MKDVMGVSWTMPLSSSSTMVALTLTRIILIKLLMADVTHSGLVAIL
jgi:hypothetical protein